MGAAGDGADPGGLRDVYPDCDDHFDLVVAENGAVLAGEDGVRDLVPSVAPELGGALAHRDIAIRRGRVLLASAARDAGVVLEEIGRLGWTVSSSATRELMVLPAGVTKGTGLFRGLTDLGISRHRTVAISDVDGRTPIIVDHMTSTGGRSRRPPRP